MPVVLLTFTNKTASFFRALHCCQCLSWLHLKQYSIAPLDGTIVCSQDIPNVVLPVFCCYFLQTCKHGHDEVLSLIKMIFNEQCLVPQSRFSHTDPTTPTTRVTNHRRQGWSLGNINQQPGCCAHLHSCRLEEGRRSAGLRESSLSHISRCFYFRQIP